MPRRSPWFYSSWGISRMSNSIPASKTPFTHNPNRVPGDSAPVCHRCQHPARNPINRRKIIPIVLNPRIRRAIRLCDRSTGRKRMTPRMDSRSSTAGKPSRAAATEIDSVIAMRFWGVVVALGMHSSRSGCVRGAGGRFLFRFDDMVQSMDSLSCGAFLWLMGSHALPREDLGSIVKTSLRFCELLQVCLLVLADTHT